MDISFLTVHEKIVVPQTQSALSTKEEYNCIKIYK